MIKKVSMCKKRERKRERETDGGREEENSDERNSGAIEHVKISPRVSKKTTIKLRRLDMPSLGGSNALKNLTDYLIE